MQETLINLIAADSGVSPRFRAILAPVQVAFPRADFQILTRRDASYDSTSPVALPSGPYDLAEGR